MTATIRFSLITLLVIAAIHSTVNENGRFAVLKENSLSVFDCNEPYRTIAPSVSDTPSNGNLSVPYEIKQMGDSVIRMGQTCNLRRGFHYVFGNLTIKQGGLLRIYEGNSWWLSPRKWAIIEVMNHFSSDGLILASNWETPFCETVNANDKIQINGRSFPLDYKYNFGAGGDGGNGACGTYDRYAQPLSAAKSSKGTLYYGGSGGGGFGYIDAYPGGLHREIYCVAGTDASGRNVGAGGPGLIQEPRDGRRIPTKGGDGGLGGETPKKGVGGLLALICHGSIFFGEKGIINIQGTEGNPGFPGTNSTPVNIVGGGGGGGGGSAGLPGGKVYVFYKDQEVDFYIQLERAKGGKGGSQGHGYVLGRLAEDGKDGKDGLPGEFQRIFIDL
jgi:hypothetical protein